MKVSDIVKMHKLYAAKIFVQQQNYRGYMDVSVSAPNLYVARELIKRMYNVKDYVVTNLREVR
jgi:hypothetical protein